MKAEFMKRRSRLPGKKARAVLAVLLLLITLTVLAAWIVVTYHAGMDKQPVPESSAPPAGPLWTAADRRTVRLGVVGASDPDPAQAAARAGGRVRLIDLSRRFCDAGRCYPVIGGAYVYRDFNHMNPVFNSTLGPHLLRALRR